MDKFKPVLTKAQMALGDVQEFKVFTYEPRKRRGTGSTETTKTLNSFKSNQDAQKPSHNSQTKTINFKKAQKEVINLGVSGISDKNQKDAAEIALAVKLGAKPPSKPYWNYKKMIEYKQTEKLKEKERDVSRDPYRVAKKFQSGATQSFQKYGNMQQQVKKKAKKQPKNVLEAYGKVKPKDKKGLKKIGNISKKGGGGKGGKNKRK